jgi:diketogulonate reductase-like aldo/keto reductase
MNTITSHRGVAMPKMIYGTAWKKERTSELVAMAIKAGFRGIDTACQPKHYEEPLVGQAIQAALAQEVEREALFIQTKFTPIGGQDPTRIPYDPNQSIAGQIMQSFDVSRRNLQIEVIDSYLLHSPLYPYEELMRAWQTMEQLVAQGGVRQLGISNVYDLAWLEHLYNDATIKPAVVQNRFYRDSGYDTALRSWCQERGVVYQSFWSLSANPHLLGSSIVMAMAQKYAVQPPQILYAFLSQQGIIPLNGTTSELHMHEDLAALGLQFMPEEIAAITALLA